jgi:glycosyltransferase involved in cell wall biosynthesis
MAAERPFAAPGVQFIDRPPQRASRPQYLRTVLTSGTFYYPERQAGLVREVARRVADGRVRPSYDVVWAHSSLMARAARDCFSARILVLDVDNVASADAKRAASQARERPLHTVLRRLDLRAMRREERRRVAAFQDVVVTSGAERRLLGPIPGDIHVVPNTVDGPEHPYDPAPDRTLLFVGSLDYDVNVDALTFLIREILPGILERSPEARLTVVGRSPTERVRALAQHRAVELVANASDLEPFYASARCVVAPLRLGGGTRIKVLEAMARGLPMVLTPEAAEGLDVRDGREAFIERQAEPFAARCVELLGDRERADSMGKAGRRTWDALHRPDRAMERIGAIIARDALHRCDNCDDNA